MNTGKYKFQNSRKTLVTLRINSTRISKYSKPVTRQQFQKQLFWQRCTSSEQITSVKHSHKDQTSTISQCSILIEA